ncbi:MAG: hypothetical protein FWF08_10260, partial [Oscillospiraceae bacterium]|nr:hypothetical protein [Oscillospiraceae bacterium]
MKKKITKVFALVLSVALILPALLMTASAEYNSGYYRQNHLNMDEEVIAARDAEQFPVILIPGISQSLSYLADENGDVIKNSDGSELSGGLLIIDGSKLTGTLVKKLLFPLLLT